MSIAEEIAKLAPSAIVTLYVLDATELGGEISYWHPGANKLGGAVVWQGQEYLPWPVEASGFEYTSKGKLPRPTLGVSNRYGLMSILVRDYDDLLGAKVIRRRTLAKFLDAANFPGGVNPDADPTAELPPDVYYIDRKTAETRDGVSFELAAAFDCQGVMLPRRQILRDLCGWRYRGAECGYAGTAYFTALDAPTTDPTKDVCGKRLSSCKVRFGANNPLPFGGFPAAGLMQ